MVDFGSSERESATIYRIMTSVVVPRPIAFVGSRSPEGIANLAPFSFFNMITATPPTIAISIGSRGGRPKDTAANIQATGDFIVHLVSESLLPAMNVASADLPPEIDEFAAAGLTPVDGSAVNAPRIAEAAVAMECRRVQMLTLGSPVRRTFHVIGEVLHFHIDDSVLDAQGAIVADLLTPVGRMGRGEYVRLGERLLMPAPTLAADGLSATTTAPLPAGARGQ